MTYRGQREITMTVGVGLSWRGEPISDSYIIIYDSLAGNYQKPKSMEWPSKP